MTTVEPQGGQDAQDTSASVSPTGLGSAEAPEPFGLGPTGAIPSADTIDLCRLLNEAASHEHEKIADRIDALRDRLGRDGLTMEEWNALVGSASHHRIEAWRRQEAANASAIEAQRATTAQTGVVGDESAVSKGDAQ